MTQESIAVRIPKELGFAEVAQEVEIERVGDALVVRPVRTESLGGAAVRYLHDTNICVYAMRRTPIEVFKRLAGLLRGASTGSTAGFSPKWRRARRFRASGARKPRAESEAERRRKPAVRSSRGFSFPRFNCR